MLALTDYAGIILSIIDGSGSIKHYAGIIDTLLSIIGLKILDCNKINKHMHTCSYHQNELVRKKTKKSSK